ncbi:MAG: response regulator transcription factor, partial [Bacteroidota bacterium]
MKETKKILIIEDDPDVIDNIEDVLELKGYKVIAARSGKVGIKHAKANIPDLIICDIMMPGMDGYEVLDTLKNDPATYSIPFLFLSAKAEREDLRRGMDLGADDYITKPFENKDILSAVETRLKKHSKIEKLYSD